MRTEITDGPAFAQATLHLDAGETVRAEAGAMVAMSPSVDIETSTQGGFMKGLRRSLGGESFFMNTFTAREAGSVVRVAPPLPGDIVSWSMDGSHAVFLQSGSYLASPETIEVDSKWGGSKTFFSREGLVMLKCTGVGDLVVSSYGAIQAIDLAAGEQYVVDTGHMVGWQEGVNYEVRKVGNWKSTVLSGEGLVVTLTGPGRVYTQTRSPEAFLGWIIPKLPKQTSS
ncbi:TIGR00266 family protein [Salsipaludibacter albus]|uniref:TIGR00266 family protein n=1 Tax=Salsipaludibacter albus TaxID=2849650 RepID=UPI001EE3DAB0|nr:TIGR00266 family protein [Salsipaludibacter albus]MBY5163316.1 TIGR00266 family protein [Salsipaludibacter albus]